MHLGGGLHRNTKTVYSVDFTTLCRRTREGSPCVYCYVARSRASKYNAKEVIDYEPYNGFVRDLTPKTKGQLNALGGIRLFAYADYLPEHDEDLRQFLTDCTDARLRVKAITKETSFVEKYADHPALSTVHVSVDALGGPPEGRSPIDFETAKALREKHGRVLVRAVALDKEDLEFFGSKPWADVLTLNHAVWPKRGEKTFHLFSSEEKKEAARHYPDRVCAAGPSGKCKDCPVKCGVPRLDEKVRALSSHKTVTL